MNVQRQMLLERIMCEILWRPTGSGISDLNYPLRKQFEALLQEKYSDNACRKYLLAYDRIKQYSISKELQLFTKGKHQNPQYRDEIFYLLYYPDSELNEQFLYVVKKEILIWDFTIDVPESIKRQIFMILCDTVRTQRRRQTLTEKLSALLDVYHYCCEEAIQDIEQIAGTSAKIRYSGYSQL